MKNKQKIISILIFIGVVITCFIAIKIKNNNDSLTLTEKCPENTQIDQWSYELYEKNDWNVIDKNTMNEFQSVREIANAALKRKNYEDKYSNILYEEKEYWYCNREIAKEKLGQKLDIKKSKTFMKEEKIEEVYEIKDFKTTYYIAVKWHDDNRYYVYCTYAYIPENLNQYIQDLGVKQENILAYMYIYVEDEKREKAEKDIRIVYLDKVESMLQNDIFHVGGKYQGEGESVARWVIEVYLKDIDKNMEIGFSKNDDLVIWDMDNHQYYMFEYGEENVKALQKYIEDEMQGYLLEEEITQNDDAIKPTELPLQ